MVEKIGVVPGLEAKVRSFLEEEGAALELAPPGEGMIQVEAPAPGEESGPDRLYPEGRIACALALEMARRTGITPAQMGRFLNLLEIKIRKCQLGCF